ncbi:alpha/beta hydrolase fold family protein [Mycobacterium xenopi 3993]|nr:alpha/beta hydrolase fold family protein [Mycobacterium xenopi 3993]
MPAMQQPAQRFVDSADGIRIAVYEEGNRDGPTVVLVHGWPDSHVLWDGVVPLLADRFRVIRYDNRGVGASAAPKPASAYTMARFADDFAAVIDACSPDRPVHALAHDWGSVGSGSTCAAPTPATGSPRSLRCPAQPAPPRRLHLQRSAPPVPPASLRQSAQPGIAAELHGGLLDTAIGTAYCSTGLVQQGNSTPTGRGYSRRAGPPLAKSCPGCGIFGKDLPRQLLSVVRRCAARPLRRRAGSTHRQHRRPVRAALRVRRHRPLGPAAVAARHQGGPLVTDVAPAGAGERGA